MNTQANNKTTKVNRQLTFALLITLILFGCYLSTHRDHYHLGRFSQMTWRSKANAAINKSFSGDCSCLFDFNKTHHNKVCTPKKDLTTDEDVHIVAKAGCHNLLDKYSFYTDTDYIYQTEYENPIAFSLVVHKNVHQLLMLLSAIYSFQNVYCVHVDLKSPDAFMETLRILQGCLPNLLLSSKREDVIYQDFSRLQADINCMKDLVKIPASLYDWKYLINLCGQDFPIRTNLEMVEQLIELKGRNLINGFAKPLDELGTARTKYVHEIVNKTQNDGHIVRKVVRSARLKSPPPFNITIRKNLAYNIFSRSFLQWVLFESEKAQALLEWSRDTKTPDEHYWSMLDALDEAPGRTGRVNTFHLSPFVVWRSKHNKCGGYWNHYSCVFGANDIPTIISSREFFANKFDSTFDVIPLQCMRKLLDERRRGIRNKLNPAKTPIKLD